VTINESSINESFESESEFSIGQMLSPTRNDDAMSAMDFSFDKENTGVDDAFDFTVGDAGGDKQVTNDDLFDFFGEGQGSNTNNGNDDFDFFGDSSKTTNSNNDDFLF
jgi:hypothetical protein